MNIDYKLQFLTLCEALRDSNVIGAIKAYRSVTGHGLKEAKDAIEAMIDGGTAWRTQRTRTDANSDSSGQWVTLRVEDSCTFDSRDAAITDARSSVTAHGWWYVAKVTDVAKCEVTVAKVAQ